MTREDWLNRMAVEMRPLFEAAGAPLPPKFRVTMSLTKSKKAIGTCFDSSCSADGHFEILVRLDQHDPLQVAAILAHELVHAAVGIQAKHGPEFRKVATEIGLEGKMTATVPGEIFKAAAAPLLEKVGPFPHAPLDWNGSKSGPKKQTARMIKVHCTEEGCGFVCRQTRKWLEEKGAAHCPEHGEMEVAT